MEAFNAKQKRADRKKALDYHAEVVERRATSKEPEHETKPFYEYVIGAGDRNGVMGVMDSEFDNALWRRLKDGYTDEDGNEVGPDYRAADQYVRAHLNEHPYRDELKRALTEHMEGLQERYPNFKFTCIEGHDDEPNGSFHFHVRFFPVAEGYKNGMGTRCGFEQGARGDRLLRRRPAADNAVAKRREERAGIRARRAWIRTRVRRWPQVPSGHGKLSVVRGSRSAG